MFVGIILGFQNRLKLPDHPFVDPRILKRLYAKLKKTKQRRPRRQCGNRQTCAKPDSRGTACRRSRIGSRGRARTPGKHNSAIEHIVTPRGESSAYRQEAQTQALETPIASSD
jgi:hypothetical protein